MNAYSITTALGGRWQGSSGTACTPISVPVKRPLIDDDTITPRAASGARAPNSRA
jgi:hypothetical protein